MKSKKPSMIVIPTKVPSYYSIGIYFSDGRKLVKQKCSQRELFETYFLGLDKYLGKPIEAEQLFDAYQNKYKESDIKVVIQYHDSWGHLWKGKVAWPREVHFINYLKEMLNESNKNN